jgi:hypothetical protein
MKINILLFLFITICDLARASEPEALVDFFGHAGIADKSSAYYGEMLDNYANEPTLGESLPGNVQVTFRRLEERSGKAVYAVLLSDGEHTEDWYAFLVEDNNIWKLSAVRTLALTGTIEYLLNALENKTSRTHEEEWQYQNMLLILKSDKGLKAYLREKLVDFKNIIDLFHKGEKEQAEAVAKCLYLNYVKDNDGVVEFNIGGLTDNTVGFLYVPPGKVPPVMDSVEYIYVEEIVEGWYIYKTT